MLSENSIPSHGVSASAITPEQRNQPQAVRTKFGQDSKAWRARQNQLSVTLHNASVALPNQPTPRLTLLAGFNGNRARAATRRRW